MFDHHLFISYAHVDNRHSDDVPKGWIDLLHERLEIRLAQLLGKPPNIWRDRKLAGNDDFSQTIVIELAKTALMISVVSPRYVESPSCRSEIDDFFRLADEQGGVQLGDKHRVFKVIKTHVAYEKHPPGLQKLLGYEFYQLDQESGRLREFDHEISQSGNKDKRYWEKFEDLAWGITELIKRLESKSDAAQSSTPSGATVYLAETTTDLTDERDKVKRELQQFGHTVLPDKPLPTNAPALQSAVRDYLKTSRLSVHLIGKHYGIIPEMERERSVIRMQQELAIERGDDANFSRLIWMPVGLQPEDERQQQFVAHLQNSFQSRNGSELLQTKFADLQTVIRAKLDKKPVSTPAAATGEDSLIKIYLLHHPQDEAAIKPLKKYLIGQGYEVILPLTEGEPAELIQDHKDNIVLCDAILIFRGQASEKWLDQKVKDLLKLRTLGRTEPLLAKAIYLGSPPSESKDEFMTNAATVIRDHGDFNPESLAAFIAQINQAKGAQQ